MEPWVVWVLAAILLFTLEVFVPGFFLACLGVGCLIAGLVSMAKLDVTIQFLIFALATLLVFIGIRPFFLKYLYKEKNGVRTNMEALIGKTGVVTEEIHPLSWQGRVKVGGEEWKAESIDGLPVPAGETVAVERIEGNKIIVQKYLREEEGR